MGTIYLAILGRRGLARVGALAAAKARYAAERPPRARRLPAGRGDGAADEGGDRPLRRRPREGGGVMAGYDKLIFELSSPGREAYSLPESDVPAWDPRVALPASYVRAEAPALPEVSEFDVVRHYSRLSRMNYGVDTHFSPLGSCTMKYNPRLNE